MGTGIGKYCVRCGNQLDYADGFNNAETLCSECEHKLKIDLLSNEDKERLLNGESLEDILKSNK
jgi:hypothetical protein